MNSSNNTQKPNKAIKGPKAGTMEIELSEAESMGPIPIWS